MKNTFETSYYNDFAIKSPILKQIEFNKNKNKKQDENQKVSKKFIQLLPRKVKKKCLQDYFTPKSKQNQIIETQSDCNKIQEKQEELPIQQEEDQITNLSDQKSLQTQKELNEQQQQEKEDQPKTPLSSTQEETINQQELLKTFEESHKDYFLHLSGKCKCFLCNCGKCKCDYGKRNKIIPGALQEISEYQNAFENNQQKDALQKKINEYQVMVSNFYKTKDIQEKASTITKESTQKVTNLWLNCFQIDFKRHSSESYISKLNRPLSYNWNGPMLYKNSKYSTDYLNFGSSPVGNYSKNNQISNLFPPVSRKKTSLYSDSYKQFDGKDGRINVSLIRPTNPIDFSQIPFLSQSQYQEQFKSVDVQKVITNSQISEKNNLFSYSIRSPTSQFKTISSSSFVNHGNNICPAMCIK